MAVRPDAQAGTVVPTRRHRPAARPWRITWVAEPDPAAAGPAAPTLRPAGRHRILPATVSLAVVLNTTDCPSRPPAFVHAPHARPVQFDGECSASYVQVTLSPPAAVRLLGLPLGSLGDGLVDLRDLFGAAGRRIVDRVREAGDRSRQTALLERCLARRILSGPALTPEVAHVWRRLAAAGGFVSIGRLPDEVGWTHRHLIDRFRREIGVTPKTAARLLRLDHLWRSLDRFDGGATGCGGYRWAELAAQTGYADQSHLIREFRLFTGTTPTLYLARRRPGEHGGPLSAVAGELATLDATVRQDH